MSRSIWKGIFISRNLLNKALKEKNKKNKKPIKVWSRKSTILPQFIESNFKIHNGKTFIPLCITEDMVGHKFGEFAPTRVRCIHKKKKNKK
jgi:small subunit ribosomal protein S19